LIERLMRWLDRTPSYRLVWRLYHRHEQLGPPLLFLGGVTFKQHVRPGQWRVSVETEDGRPIGRVSFTVVAADSSREASFTTRRYD